MTVPPMQGFSLVEMMLVIGLIGILGSLTAFQDIGAYTRILARTDADTIMSALVKARSDAMQGICANDSCEAPSAHGVMIQGHQATVFEGQSYEGRARDSDESFPFEDIRAVSGPHEVVFAPATGEPYAASVTTLVNGSGAQWNLAITSTGAITLNVVSGSTGSTE